MELVYAAVDDEAVDRVALSPNERALRFRARTTHGRAAGVPAEELEGVATVTGGTVVTIRELTVRRRDGVSTGTVQALPVGKLRRVLSEDLARYRLLDQLDRLASQPSRWLAAEAAPEDAARREDERRELRRLLGSLKRRAPKRGASDDFYRDMARAYLLVQRDHPRDPTGVLLRELRESARHANLSRNTAAAWIRAARRDAWLTNARANRPGAEPGAKLLEWQRKERSASAQHSQTSA